MFVFDIAGQLAMTQKNEEIGTGSGEQLKVNQVIGQKGEQEVNKKLTIT